MRRSGRPGHPPKWNPKDWRILDKDETPLPGDIVAYPLPYDPHDRMRATGHSGVQVESGVMASHQTGVYVVPGQFSGQKVVIRRYIGE